MKQLFILTILLFIFIIFVGIYTGVQIEKEEKRLAEIECQNRGIVHNIETFYDPFSKGCIFGERNK
jgi:hypothetical protein